MIAAASRIVPAAQREEWRNEWQAEVWHRWRFYVDAGAWNRTEALRLLRNCLGAFVDAACHAAAQESIQHRFHECARSPWTCVAGVFAVLLMVAGLSGGLPATRDLLIAPGYRNPGRLEVLSLRSETGRGERGFHPITVADWRHSSHLLEALAPFRLERAWIAETPSQNHKAAAPARRLIVRTEPELLQMLNVKPVVGSFQPGAVLSNGTWRSQFGGDPRVIGAAISVDHESFRITGVLPANFHFLSRQDAVFLVQPRLLDGRVLVAAYPRRGAKTEDIERELASISQDDDYYRFSSHMRITRVQDTLLTPLGYFSIGAGLSALMLSILCRVRLQRPRFAARAAVFFASKVVLALIIVFTAGLEWTRPDDSFLLLWRDNANGPALVWMYVAGAMAVLFWALADQRARCRVCLRLLCFPVRVGCPGCLLLDWSGTELLCSEGHGVLHVPDMATSWESDSDRWISLDESWRELFARR